MLFSPYSSSKASILTLKSKVFFNENLLTIMSLNASRTTSPKEVQRSEVSVVLQIKIEVEVGIFKHFKNHQVIFSHVLIEDTSLKQYLQFLNSFMEEKKILNKYLRFKVDFLEKLTILSTVILSKYHYCYHHNTILIFFLYPKPGFPQPWIH